MTIQTTSRILTLPPALNALAVIAQSSHDLLVEVERTKEVYKQHVQESQATITSQAEENQRLKAELASMKQLHAREIVELKSVHAAENAKNSSAIKNYVGRIDALNLENTNRKKDYAALQIEWKEHKKWREEYYDIIGGLRGRPGFSRSSALAKCKKHGLI